MPRSLSSRAALLLALPLSLALAAAPREAHAGPGVAPPTLGPQRDLSAPNYGADFTDDSDPVVATNGTDFLVVWDSSGSDGTYAHATRFTANGTILDRDAIELKVSAPKLAQWDGQRYLVAGDGVAQWIDPATGAVSAPTSLRGPIGKVDYAFASGDGFTIDVWGNDLGGNGGEVYASIVDATGKLVVDGVALATGVMAGASVAYANGHFLVSWIPYNTGFVSAARISTAGVVEDATPLAIDAGHVSSLSDGGGPFTGVSNVHVASSGASFLVTWLDARDSAAVYAARVGTDGALADPGGFLVAKTGGHVVTSSATWTGADWWLAWGWDAQVTGVSVGANASVGQPVTLASPNGKYFSGPALIANGSMRLCVWGEDIASGGAGDIRGVRVDASGHPIDPSPRLFSSYLLPQQEIRVTASAHGYGVTWVEPDTMRALRLRDDGTPIDPEPIVLGPSRNVVGASKFFAAMGDAYVGMMAPARYEAIPLVKIAGPPGAASDGGGPLTTYAALGNGLHDATPLSLACMSDRCLVVWYEYDQKDITFAQILDAQGAPLTAAMNVGSSGYAAAATDGASFLVALEGTVVPIAANGTVGTSATVTDGKPSALVWGGDRYLLLGAKAGTLQRLTASGDALGATEPVPSFGGPYAAQIAWDGRAFLLMQGSDAAELPALAPSSGLVSFPLFASALATGVASAASTPDGALVVGSEMNGGHARAVARMLSTRAVDPGADAGGDAGDAGLDAGARDASVSPDAGKPDATAADGGIAAADASAPAPSASDGDGSGGCSCTTAGEADSSGTIASLVTLAIAIAAAARARQRRTTA